MTIRTNPGNRSNKVKRLIDMHCVNELLGFISAVVVSCTGTSCSLIATIRFSPSNVQFTVCLQFESMVEKRKTM